MRARTRCNLGIYIVITNNPTGGHFFVTYIDTLHHYIYIVIIIIRVLTSWMNMVNRWCWWWGEEDDKRLVGWSAIGLMLIWNPSSIFGLTKKSTARPDDKLYSRNNVFSQININQLHINLTGRRLGFRNLRWIISIQWTARLLFSALIPNTGRITSKMWTTRWYC